MLAACREEESGHACPLCQRPLSVTRPRTPRASAVSRECRPGRRRGTERAHVTESQREKPKRGAGRRGGRVRGGGGGGGVVGERAGAVGAGSRETGQAPRWPGVPANLTVRTAEEGEAQGGVAVARGVRALDGPADAFVHPAVVANQEAAGRAGGHGLRGWHRGTPLREEPLARPPKGQRLEPGALTGPCVGSWWPAARLPFPLPRSPPRSPVQDAVLSPSEGDESPRDRPTTRGEPVPASARDPVSAAPRPHSWGLPATSSARLGVRSCPVQSDKAPAPPPGRGASGQDAAPGRHQEPQRGEGGEGGPRRARPPGPPPRMWPSPEPPRTRAFELPLGEAGG